MESIVTRAYSVCFTDKLKVGVRLLADYVDISCLHRWKYFSEDKLGGTSYWGKLGTYSGGGSYIDLKIDEPLSSPVGSGYQQSTSEKAQEQIKFLKASHWITRATRVIFFDFSVYNANVNLFSIVK